MDNIDEDTADMSLADIYNYLLEHNEIIITVPKEQEKTVRTGLASVKAKQNKKLKDSGISASKESLSFSVIPNKDNPANLIDMHILLSKRTSIQVVSMQLPDKEL